MTSRRRKAKLGNNVHFIVLWLNLLLLVTTALARPGVLIDPSNAVDHSDAKPRDGSRDLFDQLLHKISSQLFRGSSSSSSSSSSQGNNDPSHATQSYEWAWNVHPLPRRRLFESRQLLGAATSPQVLAPSAANSNANANANDEESGSGLASPLSAAGGSSPATLLAAAAAAASGASSSQAAVSNLQSSPPASSTSPAVGSNASPATTGQSLMQQSALPASSSASIAASTPNLGSAGSSTPSSSPSLVASLAKLASSSSVSTSATSSATPTPTPTKASLNNQVDDTAQPSLLSPKNKIFPLIVAGLACAGVLGLMLLIAIARAIAHDQLRRDKLKRTYGFDDYDAWLSSGSGSGNSKGGTAADKFTKGPPPGMAAAARRSLRRAITRKKLGSFARRQKEGSVLIEVGDEVFAVPPHLADTYRDRILQEKRSRSDLTLNNNGDSLFGNIRPKHLTDAGPDGDDVHARLAYDEMLNGNTGKGPTRSLSQRLADRFRSLTTSAAAPPPPPLPLPPNSRWNTDANDGNNLEKGAFSFNTTHQMSGSVRQSDLTLASQNNPLLTHGSSEWSISQSNDPNDPNVGTPSAASAPPMQQRTTGLPLNLGPVAPPPRSMSKPPTLPHSTRKQPPKVLELNLLTAKLQDLERQGQGNRNAHNNHQRTKSTRRSYGRLPPESSLSHSRVTLTDEGASSSSSAQSSAHGTFGGSVSSSTGSDVSTSLPGALPDRAKSVRNPTTTIPQRVKSLKPLILNMDQDQDLNQVGTYRHRKAHPNTEEVSAALRAKTQVLRPTPSSSRNPYTAHAHTGMNRKSTTPIASTSLASPTRFNYSNRPHSKIVLNPEQPEPSYQSQVETIKDNFRPLPLPPPFFHT